MTASETIERRSVRYTTLDEVVADASSWKDNPVRMVGNWTQGQIYAHLAKSFDISIDGTKNAPAIMRWVLSLFFRKRFLHQAIPAGFNAGANVPPPTDTEEGFALLKQAVERQKSESQRAMHPGFGRISNEEWELFHLRHAELHMSHIAPPATPDSEQPR